jgi:hypothetical protein
MDTNILKKFKKIKHFKILITCYLMTSECTNPLCVNKCCFIPLTHEKIASFFVALGLIVGDEGCVWFEVDEGEGMKYF